MENFDAIASEKAKAIYVELRGLEIANPSIDFSGLHGACKDALDALVGFRPAVVRPEDGTPKQ